MVDNVKIPNEKFIVIYGGPNRGKTTQAEEVVRALRQMKKKAHCIKYPVYDLKPTGPLIRSYMKEGNPRGISVETIQFLCVRNQLQAQGIVIPLLGQESWVIAEDYTWTTIAYSIATGLGESFIKRIKELQKPLIKPALTFIFRGRRFMEAKEEMHIHETKDLLVDKAHKILLSFADEYDWISIQSDKPISIVTGDILSHIFPRTKYK